MARRASRPVELPTAPFWSLTYGDLMSLVLVFFVFLAAFSSIDITHYRQAQQAMKGGQGVLNQGDAVIETTLPETREFQEAMQDLGEQLQEAKLDRQVRVFWDKQGVRFVLQDAILFPPGEAGLSPAYLNILDAVVAVVRTLNVAELQVQGHTDDVPISTPQFPSNWELSSARAVSVLHYLERARLVPQRKLVAEGYGEHRPMVPNSSPENRAQNRRVEIYVLKQQ
jgi:chemotaxis protein MotB